jgi:hypothetical protein
MKVAIGFYGFIRTKITREHVFNFINFFPPDTVFDLYINCPNKLKEFDEEPFNIIEMKKELYEIFNFPNINIGKINLFQYDPFVFINKSEILKLPYYIDANNHFGCPFRIISLHNGISNICKLISMQNIEYDMIVCTRFDIFPNIISIGDCLEKINKNNIFILHEIYNYAEDLIFYSSMYGINVLSNMYDYIYDDCKIFVSIFNFCSEWIIADYLNRFPLLEKKHRNAKINYEIIVKSTIARKQPEFKKNMIYLLKEYNKKYNRNYFEDKIEFK